MRKDVQLLNAPYPMLQAINQLQQLMDETVTVVGSEVYAAALVASSRYAKDSGQGKMVWLIILAQVEAGGRATEGLI